jgi:hypothetical protein
MSMHRVTKTKNHFSLSPLRAEGISLGIDIDTCSFVHTSTGTWGMDNEYPRFSYYLPNMCIF